MQADCNLVMYNQQSEAKWSTNSAKGGRHMCRLYVTDDGKLLVDKEGDEIWNSDKSEGKKWFIVWCHVQLSTRVTSEPSFCVIWDQIKDLFLNASMSFFLLFVVSGGQANVGLCISALCYKISLKCENNKCNQQ